MADSAFPLYDLASHRKEKELWRLAREIDSLLTRGDLPRSEALQLLATRCELAAELLRAMAQVAPTVTAVEIVSNDIKVAAEMSAWDE